MLLVTLQISTIPEAQFYIVHELRASEWDLTVRGSR